MGGLRAASCFLGLPHSATWHVRGAGAKPRSKLERGRLGYILTCRLIGHRWLATTWRVFGTRTVFRNYQSSRRQAKDSYSQRPNGNVCCPILSRDCPSTVGSRAWWRPRDSGASPFSTVIRL